ncbi:hypothetical protein SB49_02680 [Sediminicola sp. YIK13]|uniref:hypothetical protein n=1 Tax=Sediminicola sp. YIK13 TaxID=1453352 RepID=UPI00071FBD20|nr:hypothetical protein [Sediminicola sp. YIK13]ALM06828.1 hypothetical protein SB49_02680 [Sediminicola sp. YIK13]
MFIKILKVSLICFLVIGLTTGCSSTVHVSAKNSAPGQVKKATGSKSAKAYAPGQQKKNKY